MTVSAVIYSRDESDLLRVCLPAVTGFDEVVVCDMQSTDDTIEVARAAGARVVSVPDARVVEEVRQLGLDHAIGDWVLFVDADEILPAGFVGHIRAMVSASTDDGAAAYRLRYSNVAFGRTLRYTLVGSAKYSLMRRGSAHFPHPARAHVPPDFDGPLRDAPTTVPPILHLNFRSVDQMNEKTMRYARDLEGDMNLVRPMGLIRELLRSTIFSGTWGDGYAGTAVSTSAVVGRWYGALLAAERMGLLISELPPSELRRLKALRAVAAVVVRLRDRFKAVLHGRRKAGPQPGDIELR